MSNEYVIEQYCKTERTIGKGFLEQDPSWKDHVIWDYQNHFIPELSQKLLSDKGIETISGEVLEVIVQSIEVKSGICRIDMILKYRIVTKQPLHETHSPFTMPLWAMKIIKWSIEAIIIGYVALHVIAMVGDVLKSMFTKTTTITKHVSDPESPEYCQTETITTTEPELPSIAMLFILIFAVFALIMILPSLTGKRKK